MDNPQASGNGIKSSIRPIYKYDHLSPTKRGWLFLGKNGGPCDKACKMCYYTYQNTLVFYDSNTLISRANLFRHYYGLEYCDISGGEATIYGPKKDGRRPELEKLISHCANIGLKPTIITHGQNNTEQLVKGIEDAGLEDWLISLHGMQSGHDLTVVNHKGEGKGGFKSLINNLSNCKCPIRFNTTLQNFNYKELPELGKWLSGSQPPTVWNMIQFNPFYAWGNKEVIEFQEQMSTMAPYVADAIEIAEKAGWEVNVRYWPFCVAAEYGFVKNCVNFYQTQYDPWEWALVATNRAPMEAVNQVGGIEAANRLFCDEIAKRRSNSKCDSCSLRAICEGPSEQYQKRYGIDELKPFTGEQITDITYFEKVTK